MILASWVIAFFEYCLVVPANRMGHEVYAPSELKVIQEVITLCVFAVFSITYLGERLTWNHVVGFGWICAGAYFVFDGPFGKGSGLRATHLVPSPALLLSRG